MLDRKMLLLHMLPILDNASQLFAFHPEEVENLLILADFRASAGGLGIDSILQNGEGFVLHLKVPVGGAKIALQRALGPSVNVGNQQINLPARTMGDEWLSRLTRVIGRFRAFQDRLQSLAS